MYKDAKIYVAGHTGLLGSALMAKLKEHGYSNVIAKPHSALDLPCREAVFKFFATERPEYVFLAAGKVGGIASNKTCPADYLHSNIAIQDNVFEAARGYGVRHLLFYGSSCAYPRLSAQPMKEEYLLDGPIEPTSEGYAVAKIAGIIACRAYNRQYRTGRFIALVPNSIYGPHDNFELADCHVLSALIRRLHEAKWSGSPSVTLWGSGRPRREFIFCGDAAEASLFAMRNAERLENQHYNVGTGVDYSIQELAASVARVVGYQGEILWDKGKPDGAPQKLLDSSKFMSLGWAPAVGLEEGLRKTYQWYRSRLTSEVAVGEGL
jgi:GDP-L-fucose synthase